MSRFHLATAAIVVAMFTLSVTAVAGAQKVYPSPRRGAPCCTIKSIDARTGVVTARELATGRTFRFVVGHFQPVDSFQPVDAYTENPDLAHVHPVPGFQPVDAGRARATLRAMRVGQRVWVSAGGRVSVNGAAPCCAVTLGAEPTDGAATGAPTHVGP